MSDKTPSRPRVKVGKTHLALPRWRPARIALGIALMIGGVLGFLPVLGFWMIPLGLFVLSHDIALARRLRRRLAVVWHRWRHPAKASAGR